MEAADSVVIGSEFHENDEDGIDMDDIQNILLIGVSSIGNGFDDPDDPGSGLQIEAEDDNDTHSSIIVGSTFSGNAADGILIVEEDTKVLSVSLTAVTVNENQESGLDISISGELNARAVRSENNGEADNITTG